MPQATAFARIPCYLLKSGNEPIFPKIHHDQTQCVCVYGFSDKPIYDQFIESVSELLTPYPLVNGFLSNQIESTSDESNVLRLVILDAIAGNQPSLAAATMESVLEARQKNEKQVAATYELIFQEDTKSYQFK